MSLISEIEKLMNTAESSINFRIINLGGNKVYVEGIKSVISLGKTELIFQLKKLILTISGTNLNVQYLDKSTCVITGQITSVVTKWSMN